MIELFRNWLHRNFSDPQLIILGFLVTLLFLVVFFLGNILLPVFAGIVIAYLLEGIVAKLERLRIPRLLAVLIVFSLFITFVVILLVGLLPVLSRQIGLLLQQLPAMIRSGQEQLIQLPERYPQLISEAQVRQVLESMGTGLAAFIKQVPSISLASVRGLLTVVIYLVLVPLMVFFFLKDKALIIDWFTQLLPGHRSLATRVWQDVNLQISNYIRGKIWEILILWAIGYATYKLMGMQFAMLVSLIVALSVIVPYIGVIASFFPVVLFGYFQWGWHMELAYAVIAYAALQLFDGNLLIPLLLSEVVNLHPVALIVAVLFFGGVWGIWGLFFAIPLATLVHAVLKAWITTADATGPAPDPPTCR